MPGAVRQTTLLRAIRSLCKGTQNTSREARDILRGMVCGRESQKHNQRWENGGSELRSPGSELRSPHRCSSETFNQKSQSNAISSVPAQRDDVTARVSAATAFVRRRQLPKKATTLPEDTDTGTSPLLPPNPKEKR